MCSLARGKRRVFTAHRLVTEWTDHHLDWTSWPVLECKPCGDNAPTKYKVDSTENWGRILTWMENTD